MKKKLLALLLCVGMLAEAAIPLFANDTNEIIVESDYDETENGIAVETDSEETNEFVVSAEQETYENEKTLYIEDGNITISVNDNGQTTYSQNNTEGLCNTLYLSNRDTATRYNGTVIINSVEGFEIHVVLRDLSIESNGNAFLVQGNGSVNIELDGNNILKSASPYAGLEIDTTSSIVINDVDNNGSLGAQGGGAGIGSATNRDNGKITINGGTIRAIGGFNSAGIGGGDSGSAGLITINGGSITAQCAWYGCGIGSGSYSDEGGRIIINGGSIVANSSVHGAGIGGAESGFVDEIIIDGGEITSSGCGWEAGMGDGHGNSKSVVILNGKVTSTGGKYDLGFADGAVRVTSVAGRNEDGTFTTVNHIHTFEMIVSDTPATYDSPRLISFYCLNSECSKYGELIEYPIGEKLEFVIPDDAVYYNGSYYKVYTIISNAIGSDAWSEANKYCTDVGGHLAVIGNQAENDFLAGYLKEKNYSSAYFGYTDEEVEGTWIWVDCEEVSTYENWAEGEPNSSSEDYAMFYFAGGNRFSDGQWNNGLFGTITLSDDKNFICEWNVITPPQSPTITGVQPVYTLALGDTLTLDGTLTAAGDGKLNVVTLKHNETGTTFPPRRMELNGSTNAFNLADFGALTTDEYPLNTVGVYEFVIYASADNYTVTNNAITSFAVQVVEAVPQIISVTYDSPTIVENTDVTYTIKVSGEADKVELWVDSYNVATVSDYLTSGSYRIFTSDVSIQNPGTRMFKAIAYNGTVASEPYTMEIVVEEAALPELSSVTIMQPTNGSVLIEGDSLLAKWSTPANVSSVDKYIVKVWSDVSKKYTYTNNITQNSVNIGSYYLQDVGSYSISVTAIKSGYEPSESMAYFDVEEGTKALSKPAISSPSSYGSYDAGKDMTFSWSKVSGATEYYYKVIDITDGEPGTTVLSGTTNKLSASVPGNILLAGHVIYLSVYAWSSTSESEEACAYAVIVKSDVSINVSVEELDFESTADYKTIKLTSSDSWTATASESWITLDRYSGSSDSNIKISVSKNTSDRIRCGFVEFEDSTGSVIVKVYQATSSSTYIYADTDIVRLDAKRGCSDNISITSNVSWKITSDAEWLFASCTSGTYDCDIRLVVEANSDTESRTGEITISNGSISETITVIQEGGSSPTISDFMSNYTVELGHDVPLQGVIEAFGNGKLNKVTIKCNNSGGNENTVATVDLKKLNTNTFDLADFKFATTNSNIFSGAGEYTFIIYVSADNFTVTDNSIGSFTVSVTTTQELPSVVDKGIFDIQATTVTLTAMIDSYGSGTFEKCGFDIYDANGDYIPELSGVALGRPRNNTNTFRRTVSGLTPSTKYYYCPYIKTSEGVFPPKEERELIEFTTGEAINATDFSYCMDGYEMDFGSHLQMATGDTLIFDIITQPHDADIKSINCESDTSGISGSTADVAIEVHGNSFSIMAMAPGSITIRIIMENYDGSTVVKKINLIVVDEEMICDVEYYDSFDEDDSRNIIKGVRLSDSMFTGSLGYKHDIAKFSIALVASANHLADIETVYDAFGFSHESYNYDKSDNSEEDTVAHTIASKEIYISGIAYKLVTIICRGARYNAEWAENGKVGSSDSHEGFTKAAEDVFSNATKYIESINSVDKSKIIILISGFSRSAAVSNLVAQKFNNEASFESREDKYNINNIYCYAFATPNNTTKLNSNSQNICNIINPKDIVPLVPMAGIGYGKNGYNLYLPDVSDLNNDQLNRFWVYYKNLTENRSGDEYKENFTFDKQSLTVNKLTDMLSSMCKTKEGYAIKYQKITRELLRKGFYDKNASLMELLCATYWALFSTNIDNTIDNMKFVNDNLIALDMFRNGAETLAKLYNNKQIALDCLCYIQHMQALIAAAHRQETYISWLYALSIKEMLSLKNTRTKISVKCPVDIYVYDNNGQLTGSIINNDISTGSEEIIKERAYVDGDAKMFEFLESDDYCIEIVPKATGMMSICVSDYTGNIRTMSKHYRNIPLDVEKEYQIIKAINREGEVKYQLLSSKDNIIIEDDILNEMGGAVNISTVDVGNGFSIGGGSVLAEDYVAVEAIPYVGAAFIGWYLGDKLVSTEPIYSFFATQSQTYTAKFTVSSTGSEADGYTVSGTVTSSDSNTASEEDDTIIITLANDEHAYTATVTSSGINNTVDYRIENIAAGTYTMVVSKANHVTREYEIVVSGSDVMQDVKIQLLGDVTGDGKITAKDYSRMYAHIRKTNLLTDYALQVGDVVGADGKITAKDYSRLYAHLTKTNVLW